MYEGPSPVRKGIKSQLVLLAIVVKSLQRSYLAWGTRNQRRLDRRLDLPLDANIASQVERKGRLHWRCVNCSQSKKLGHKEWMWMMEFVGWSWLVVGL